MTGIHAKLSDIEIQCKVDFPDNHFCGEVVELLRHLHVLISSWYTFSLWRSGVAVEDCSGQDEKGGWKREEDKCLPNFLVVLVILFDCQNFAI